MNFLGHFYLSYPNPELMMGNFIADDVKGKSYENYPAGIAKGILMHRTIDDWTDHHPSSKVCIDMLRLVGGKFSAVALDILYDYQIAKYWQRYSNLSLEQFTREVYATVRKQENYLTERSGHIFKYMSEENWLLQYATKEGIQEILERMGRRMKYKNNLGVIMPQFELHEPEFEKQFEVFFAQLQKEIKEKYLS